MSINVSIEIDKHTADVLQAREPELGLTVPELIPELATLESAPRDAEADEIAELDRRYDRATEASRVPHERVVQWLRTWHVSVPTVAGQRLQRPSHSGFDRRFN